MASYGKNFGFRIVPETENRLGRFATPSTGTWLIGQGVVGSGSVDSLGREIVGLAQGATPPVKGRAGVLVFEQIQYQGDDPYLTTFSDKDKAPVSTGVQLVSGPNVKVWFANTVDHTYANTRNYTGRIMVAGLGATPTVAVGDYLEPDPSGTDTTGYWKETATKANAWFVVTAIDTVRGEVEAAFLF